MRTELRTDLSEAAFQDLVIEYAQLRGWRVHHTRSARTKRGYRTPIQGDAGFPDLVLARNGYVHFAELKAEKGRTTRDQEAWIDELEAYAASRTHETHLWRPSDWAEIQEVLR